MMTPLNEAEIRVLGVMIEKALTQPYAYPMTINSILLAANQKQNREPVVEFTEAQVAGALGELIRKQLAVQAPPEPGARANRFAHRVVEVFHWDRREQAIMAELLLRGRQTAGELRSRAARMTPFPDLAAVMAALDQLQKYNPPYVQELPREPGRSANRFRHLLSGEPKTATPAAALPDEKKVRTTGELEPQKMNESAGAMLRFRESPPNSDARLDDLEYRVEVIERQVADLRRLVESAGLEPGEPQK